jgi:thioredoxin-related protein
MKRILFLLTFLVLSPLISLAQSINFTTSSWEEVVRDAGTSGKQIFLYAQTKSCRYCRQMEKEVFTNPRVIDYYNVNFISYKIDIEDGGTGEAISNQYGILAYPTYLYFDKTGKKLHQSSSFKPAEDFIQDGKNASDPNAALFPMLNRYNSGERSPVLLFNLTNALSYYQVKDNPKEKVIDEYLATQSASELESEKNLRFIFTNELGFKSKSTQYLLQNQEKFIPVLGKADVEKRAQRIITHTANTAGRSNDMELMGELKRVISTSFVDTSKVLSLAQIYFYGGRRDWPAFAKSTLTYENTVGATDWQTMYETGIYLRHFAKDMETIKTGIQIMSKVLELHKNYEHLCIYSQLENKAGNKDLALKAAKEALRVSNDEGADGVEAQELISELTKNK